MSTMSKIHIWIGKTEKEEEVYLEYFELDYSTEGDFEDPEYKRCQFCIDIQQDWYDEDMIGIIPVFSEMQSIENLLEQIPIAKTEIENVVSKSKKLNVISGNAIFYFTDSELNFTVNKDNNYNDLKYIGVFNSSLK